MLVGHMLALLSKGLLVTTVCEITTQNCALKIMNNDQCVKLCCQ